jgi:urease accessory protein
MTVGAFPQTAGSLLGTLQLSDSLFPSGRYTLSHGLEMFVETGRVHDAATLRSVIQDYLLQSLARCEAVAVAAAWQAATDDDLYTLIDIDRHLHALRLPTEASTASVRTGNQFIRTALQLVDDDLLRRFQAEVDAGRTIGGHATVIGMVTVAWGIDQTTAVLSELYAYTAALVSAALRLIRLDHVDAQAMVLRLHADMEAASAVAIDTPYRDMQAFAPMIDIMQMQHERSRMRMFAS